MKLPEGFMVCELCQEITPKTGSVDYVRSINWGSCSGSEIKGRCCPNCQKTRLQSDGYVIGRPYA